MAIYVEIIKSDEIEENFVDCKYQFSLPIEPFKNKTGKIRYKLKEVIGKLKIDKRNGEVYILELAEGDDTGASAKRAAYALIKHWQQGEQHLLGLLIQNKVLFIKPVAGWAKTFVKILGKFTSSSFKKPY